MRLRKLVTTILLLFGLRTIHAQTSSFQIILDSAKTLFKNENKLSQEGLDQFDYQNIEHLLKKVIDLNPENAEARYFLGYTYSRINSRDGRSMLDMDLHTLKKSSEQLEKVNQLSPKYKGEIIVLDPYSKITSEWGSMAMKYWQNKQPDSTHWAFNEGRKRGGFSDFVLEVNRKVLDACNKNAILISSGDNFTIPLWYLQIHERYRTDISVIDISMLNTIWYPNYLLTRNNIAFHLPIEEIDSLKHERWKDSTITIEDFSWNVKPTYNEQYLLRGDLVFLSLLKQNLFKRDIYFTFGFNEKMRLNLRNNLSNTIIIDQLTLQENTFLTFKKYTELITRYLSLSSLLNLNSKDEIRIYDSFRINLFSKVNQYISEGEKSKAKEILDILDKYGNEKDIPYSIEQASNYIQYLREQL